MVPHPQHSRVRHWGSQGWSLTHSRVGQGSGGPRDGVPTVTIRPGSGGNPAFSAGNPRPPGRGMDVGEGGCEGGPNPSPSNRSPSNPTSCLAAVGAGRVVAHIRRDGRGLGGHQWDCSTQCPSPYTPHHPPGLSHALPYEAPPAHSSGREDGWGPSLAWRAVPEPRGCCELPKPLALGTQWGHPDRPHTGVEHLGLQGDKGRRHFPCRHGPAVGSGLGAELLCCEGAPKHPFAVGTSLVGAKSPVFSPLSKAGATWSFVLVGDAQIPSPLCLQPCSSSSTPKTGRQQGNGAGSGDTGLATGTWGW